MPRPQVRPDPTTRLLPIPGIFEPYQLRTDLVPGEPDVMKDGIARAFDCNLDVKTPFHIRGDERNPDPNRIVNPGLLLSSSPPG